MWNAVYGVPIFKTIFGTPKCRFLFSYPGILGFSAVVMVRPAHPGTLIVEGTGETIRVPSGRYLNGNIGISPIDIFKFGPLDH